jgi:hypothetical protein
MMINTVVTTNLMKVQRCSAMRRRGRQRAVGSGSRSEATKTEKKTGKQENRKTALILKSKTRRVRECLKLKTLHTTHHTDDIKHRDTKAT